MPVGSAASRTQRFMNPLEAVPPDLYSDDEMTAMLLGQTPQAPAPASTPVVTGGQPGQAVDIFNGNLHTRTPIDGSGPAQTFDYSVAGRGQPQTPQARALTEAGQFMNDFAGPAPLRPGGQNMTPEAMTLYQMGLADHSQRMNNAQQSLGQVLQNQLGQADLGLRSEIARGSNGIPGAMSNAAQDSNTRARENDRYGDEARYDSFYQNAFNSFPPGTPPDVRIQRLTQRGMQPPRYMTAQPEATPPAPGRPAAAQANPIAGSAPAGSRVNLAASARPLGGIENAMETALSAFPMNEQTGQRAVPSFDANPAAVHHAITTALENIPNDQVRANWPEIQRQLTSTFGNNALDAWINTTGSPLLNMGQNAGRQQSQIRRLLGMAGMQQTPLTVGSSGATWPQRVGSLFSNPLQFFR